MHLEVQMRMEPVRVARVADESDRLARLDACTGAEASRERDAVPAAAAVVVPLRQVVVQVDVEVGGPARAVEVEHAARPARAGEEAYPARLGGERERALRSEDVDPLVRPLRAGRAEIVGEGDGPEHGEDDLVPRRGVSGLRRARQLGRRERGSRPCGKAEKGENEKRSGCRPDANHGAGGARSAGA